MSFSLPPFPPQTLIDALTIPAFTRPTTLTATFLVLFTVVAALGFALLFSPSIVPLHQEPLVSTMTSIAATRSTAAVSAGAVVKNASLFTIKRPNEERGTANHGWLRSFFTFNFANYYHPNFNSFGPLRVINEDRVTPTEGFGTHGHAEAEIFSYIVSGELEHRDSMGNVEIMKRGDLQMTSAGTGIRHSEFNRNKTHEVHFLQIWALPNTKRLKPTYYTRHITDEEKRSGLARIVGPVQTAGISEEREAAGPAPVHADLHLFATLLAPKSTVTHVFQPSLPSASSTKSSGSNPPRNAYVHVIQTSGFNQRPSNPKGARILVNGRDELGEGDGLFVTGGKVGEGMSLVNVGEIEAECLVFDLGEA